jgi:hypothetical protein
MLESCQARKRIACNNRIAYLLEWRLRGRGGGGGAAGLWESQTWRTKLEGNIPEAKKNVLFFMYTSDLVKMFVKPVGGCHEVDCRCYEVVMNYEVTGDFCLLVNQNHLGVFGEIRYWFYSWCINCLIIVGFFWNVSNWILPAKCGFENFTKVEIYVAHLRINHHYYCHSKMLVLHDYEYAAQLRYSFQSCQGISKIQDVDFSDIMNL